MSSSKRIVWDVTTLLRWGNANNVGIIRTERNYIKYFMENCKENLVFCKYDVNAKCFLNVSTEEVKKLLKGTEDEIINNNKKIAILNIFLLLDKIKSYILKVVNKKHKKYSLKYYLATFLKVVIHVYSQFKGIFFKVDKFRNKFIKNGLFNFTTNDFYITMGLDWDYNYKMGILYKLKKIYNFKVAIICYDIIAIKFPHFVPNGFTQVFSNYIIDALWASDFVFCISKRTKGDLKNLCDEYGIPTPSLRVIKLGSNFCKLARMNLDKANSNLDFLDYKNFILFVSTIEARKNHFLLYYVWDYLTDNYENVPILALVGMKGWLVDDLLYMVNKNPKMRNKIIILHGISDNELQFLYKNCLFTVFPSFYEGWGLPVSESLAFGKFAICANTGSIPEVGKDFVDYIDPYDVKGWATKIMFYVNNPQELLKREKLIQKKYKVYSWNQSSESFYNYIISILNKL